MTGAKEMNWLELYAKVRIVEFKNTYKTFTLMTEDDIKTKQRFK